MDYANGKSVSSQEERKIWEELESEIERDLEEEIKDGLSRLARQLQILYQHKRRRTTINSQNHKDGDFADLSIVIKLGFGCDIEIKEDEINGGDNLRPHSSQSEQVLETKHNHTGTTQRTSNEKKKAKKGQLVWKY